MGGGLARLEIGGTKESRCAGLTFVECLGHGAQDFHVHIHAEAKGRLVGVWNVGRQRGERGLVLTNGIRDCLESLGLMLDTD
ncbi:MAG: hypothetical protein ACOYXS_11455 [Chloroflexota bacterium]